MSIECQVSNLCSDVRCTVCGQGFVVYAGREGSLHRENMRGVVQQALRLQHESHAHPSEPFAVEWETNDPVH